MSCNLNQWITGDVITVTPVELPGAKQYQDARSAAFYALGIAVKKSQPVTLVVPGHYLSSTYTAITEAWFQKANVIVIALFEKVSEVKTAWMDRCVLQTATFGAEEAASFAEALEAARGIPGPALFNLTGTAPAETPVDYSTVLASLRKAAPDAKVWAYHPLKTGDTNLEAVAAQDKYGVLSRYIGMSGVKNVGILICPARCALLDINIFRTRYANQNMKIILLDEDRQLAELNVAQWVQSNGWACLTADDADTDSCRWLLAQQRQAVLMIR